MASLDCKGGLDLEGVRARYTNIECRIGSWATRAQTGEMFNMRLTCLSMPCHHKPATSELPGYTEGSR